MFNLTKYIVKDMSDTQGEPVIVAGMMLRYIFLKLV